MRPVSPLLRSVQKPLPELAVPLLALPTWPKMSYFSLQEMLQKSLNTVFCHLTTGAEQSRSVGAIAAAPVPLYLRRQPYPISYISPLPQLLAVASGQSAAAAIAAASQSLTALWADNLTPDALSRPNVPSRVELSAAERSLLKTLTLAAHASGQLQLQLEASSLLLWLQQLQAPCPLPVSRCLARFPVHTPLAQALQLSPLALAQVMHARCWQLAASSEPAVARSSPLAAPKEAALQALIWTLFNTVDALAAGPSPPVGPLLYALSVATDAWLAQQALAADPALAALTLRVCQRLLYHLLTDWLGQAAPESV